jgi:vancomycin resistance protein VanW
LVLWCENEKLFGELRSENELPYSYRLVEEDHHFHKEGEKFYRVSKIYREISDKITGTVLEKELVWDNHSEVMYDYNLIPKDQIR